MVEPGLPGARRPRCPVGAVEVVPTALLGVAQRLVGDGDLLETGFGRRIAGVGVGMVLAGEAPVGPFDLVFVRLPAHLEKVVEVCAHGD